MQWTDLAVTGFKSAWVQLYDQLTIVVTSDVGVSQGSIWLGVANVRGLTETSSWLLDRMQLGASGISWTCTRAGYVWWTWKYMTKPHVLPGYLLVIKHMVDFVLPKLCYLEEAWCSQYNWDSDKQTKPIIIMCLLCLIVYPTLKQPPIISKLYHQFVRGGMYIQFDLSR